MSEMFLYNFYNASDFNVNFFTTCQILTAKFSVMTDSEQV